MHNPEIHSTTYKGQRHYQLAFENPKAFHEFVNRQCRSLEFDNKATLDRIEANAKHRIASQSDWYGTPAPRSIEDLEAHHYFGNMELLETVEPKIKTHFHHYVALAKDSLITRPKLTSNSKGLGVFSFDRAVMGLYKLPMTKGNTPIASLLNQLKIALEKDKATTVKDTHFHVEEHHQMRPSITINLLAGANAKTKGDALYYVGIACALLVEYLESCLVAVAVNVLIGTTINTDSCLSVVQIKRFEDPLDKNQLLVIGSDPRYFRYNGFKALIATADYCGLAIPRSLGQITPSIVGNYIESTHTYNVLFGQSYSLSEAAAEVIRLLEKYTTSFKK